MADDATIEIDDVTGLTPVDGPNPNDSKFTGEDGTEFIVQVVDDTPIEDQNRTPIPEEELLGEPTEEELAEVGSRVQARIKKMGKQYHDERRNREKAERIVIEAGRYSKGVMTERDQLASLVNVSHKELTAFAKLAADQALSIAERNLADAHTEGDSAKIAEASKAMTAAQVALTQVSSVAKRVVAKWQSITPPEETVSTRTPPAAPERRPEPRADEWASENDWFGSNKEMTSFAYGVHETLIDEGVTPDHENYYERVDSRMREVFPSHFGSGNGVQTNEIMTPVGTGTASLAPKRGAPVVAPSGRNNGATTRTVTLTASQAAMADLIGIPRKEYAKQILKGARING